MPGIVINDPVLSVDDACAILEYTLPLSPNVHLELIFLFEIHTKTFLSLVFLFLRLN